MSLVEAGAPGKDIPITSFTDDRKVQVCLVSPLLLSSFFWDSVLTYGIKVALPRPPVLPRPLFRDISPPLRPISSKRCTDPSHESTTRKATTRNTKMLEEALMEAERTTKNLIRYKCLIGDDGPESQPQPESVSQPQSQAEKGVPDQEHGRKPPPLDLGDEVQPRNVGEEKPLEA
jgi:hypothetical protein